MAQKRSRHHSRNSRQNGKKPIGARFSGTTPELKVRDILTALGFRILCNVSGLPGTPDVIVPALNIVFQVHGCFWHQHDCGKGRVPKSNREFWEKKFTTNKKRDVRAFNKLTKAGFMVVEIWECQTKNLSLTEHIIRTAILQRAEQMRLVQLPNELHTS